MKRVATADDRNDRTVDNTHTPSEQNTDTHDHVELAALAAEGAESLHDSPHRDARMPPLCRLLRLVACFVLSLIQFPPAIASFVLYCVFVCFACCRNWRRCSPTLSRMRVI
jgi:hypothetical protein